jgi:hypothetical protein
MIPATQEAYDTSWFARQQAARTGVQNSLKDRWSSVTGLWADVGSFQAKFRPVDNLNFRDQFSTQFRQVLDIRFVSKPS